jgi:hypothetical protein
MPFLIGKKMIIMRRAYARQKKGRNPLLGQAFLPMAKTGFARPAQQGARGQSSAA